MTTKRHLTNNCNGKNVNECSDKRQDLVLQKPVLKPRTIDSFITKIILMMILLFITAMFMFTCSSLNNLDMTKENMKGSYVYQRKINLQQWKSTRRSESVNIENKTVKRIVELLDEIEFSNCDLAFLKQYRNNTSVHIKEKGAAIDTFKNKEKGAAVDITIIFYTANIIMVMGCWPL